VSVGDFILDRIPTLDLTFWYIWGFMICAFMMSVYAVFVRPDRLPFMMKTIGLLVIIRAFFVVMTHVGPPIGSLDSEAFYQQLDPVNKYFFRFFKNDLFFSGHTAIPFMGFLLFRESEYFKYVLLGFSIFMAATVLLTHMHYSIDVFAAFFITYGIFGFSNMIFNKLNERFKRRVKLYGWNSFQKKMNTWKKNKEL